MRKAVSIVGNVNADIVTRPVTEPPPPGGDLLVDMIDLRRVGLPPTHGSA